MCEWVNETCTVKRFGLSIIQHYRKFLSDQFWTLKAVSLCRWWRTELHLLHSSPLPPPLIVSSTMYLHLFLSPFPPLSGVIHSSVQLLTAWLICICFWRGKNVDIVQNREEDFMVTSLWNWEGSGGSFMWYVWKTTTLFWDLVVRF